MAADGERWRFVPKSSLMQRRLLVKATDWFRPADNRLEGTNRQSKTPLSGGQGHRHSRIGRAVGVSPPVTSQRCFHTTTASTATCRNGDVYPALRMGRGYSLARYRPLAEGGACTIPARLRQPLAEEIGSSWFIRHTPPSTRLITGAGFLSMATLMQAGCLLFQAASRAPARDEALSAWRPKPPSDSTRRS